LPCFQSSQLSSLSLLGKRLLLGCGFEIVDGLGKKLKEGKFQDEKQRNEHLN
jgi:hypothetical protein